MGYPRTLERLIENLSKLQGIGRKTAERLAFNLIKSSENYIIDLSESITELKDNIKIAPLCHCLTDLDQCGICNDSKRRQDIICVVKDQQDTFHIEKSGYNGFYHVLGGLISPLDGVGVEDLNFKNLLKRLDNISEIILAIPSNVEGEATSFYIRDMLKNYNIKLTKPAMGLPVGVNIEYVDHLTLQSSFNKRISIDD